MFYIKHNVCSFKCTCIIVTDTCNTAKPMNLTKSMLTHVIVAHVSVCNKYSTTCNAEKRFIRYEAFQNAFSFYSVLLLLFLPVFQRFINDPALMYIYAL